MNEFQEKFLHELSDMIAHTLEKLNQREKELFKLLDENQKVCYNKYVDLCEN